MERHHFKDVDDSIAPLINQIKALQQQGDYSKIDEIVQNNQDKNLLQYFLTSDYINAIDEEIRNLEIFTISKKQSIYYLANEPNLAERFDVWIGD